MKPVTVCAVLVSMCGSAFAQPCDTFWDPASADWSFQGGRGVVNAIKEYAPPGQAPVVFIAGSFNRTGADRLENVAAWDGTQWVSAGSLPGVANDLEVFDDGQGPRLYAAGRFRTGAPFAGIGMRRWTGAAWEEIPGPDGTVTDLQVYNDGTGLALYACGSFTTAGGVTVNGIARYRSGAWSPVGATNLLVNLTPSSMSFSATQPRAGLTVAGTPSQQIANLQRWTGAQWVADSAGAGGLQAIRVGRLNDRLYASVNFSGGIFQGNTSWTTLPGAGTFQYFGTVYAMQEFNDGNGAELFMGGDFDLFACASFPCPSTGLAAYNGTRWRLIRPAGWQDDPLQGAGVVRALAPASGATRLVFGGAFDGVRQPATQIGQPLPAPTIRMNSVGWWNGSQFGAMGEGVSVPGVRSILQVSEGGVEVTYVGGDFQTVNGQPIPYFAKYRDGVWSAPIPNLNGAVRQIVPFQGGVVVRGDFSRAGAASVQGLARVDAAGTVQTFLALPFGVTMASSLATGSFQGVETLFVGTSGKNGSVARFQPAGPSGFWITLTSGLSVSDLTLAPDGSALYAIGNQGPQFRSVRIASTGQQTTLTLPNAINSVPGKFAWVPEASGSVLYVNGIFVVGNRTANLARLDNTTFSLVGSDSFLLSDLEVFDAGGGPALYGAGYVQLAEGPASLVRWNSSRWEHVGTFNGGAEALMVRQTPSQGRMTVVGYFTRVDDLDVDGFAVLRRCDFCPADINRDARVDADDVIDFFAGWDAGAPVGDFDGSGGVDGDDVIAFFGRWNGGC